MRACTRRAGNACAARAIVDRKLASGAWTVAQATACFGAQTGFTREAAQAAVAGIPPRPGYVTFYTVGRVQLELLLAEYQQRMGERASLRDFHDRLLSYGSVPFVIVGLELLSDLDRSAAVVREQAGY